jgi:hypothetical protein
MPSSRISTRFSFFAVTAALVVACGDAEVPKADVEQQAMKTLSATVGKESPPITCPGNLKAKVGTTMTCSISLDGKTHDVTITVTGIEGTNAKFNVEVASNPRP